MAQPHTVPGARRLRCFGSAGLGGGCLRHLHFDDVSVQTQCPATVTNKVVQCGTTWTFDAPTPFDQCSGTNVSVSVSTVTNGTCPQIITRTWTLTDLCGNSNTWNQTVTVMNTNAAQLNCNCLVNSGGAPLVLTVTACTSSIPDLCLPASLCTGSSCGFVGCSQSPPAGTVVGPGVYPITVTVYDCASNSASCGVTFTVIAPATGCPTNTCVPPPSGLIGWWPLDEACGATVFGDLSGSGNVAFVESGGPSCSLFSPNAVPGKVAGANYFYGATVRGRALNAPSLNFGTNSFSADGWVNPVLTGTIFWHPIVDKLQVTGGGTGFGYSVSLLNTKVVLRTGDGLLRTNTSLGSLNYGTWNFVGVAVDRAAGTVTFHVNGVTETPQTLAAAGSLNSPVDLLIGGTYAVNAPYGELAIDELELFNRALAPADFNLLWQADSLGKCKTNQPCSISVACPTNLVVQACATNAIVTYPLPTLSGPCASNATIVCVPPSGSSFPAGTNTVNCAVLDANGLLAGLCSFTVAVVPGPSCPVVVTATLAGGNIVLSWRQDATYYFLEEAPGLVGPLTTWAPVTNTPVVVNGEYQVTLPIQTVQGFYRLKQILPR